LRITALAHKVRCAMTAESAVRFDALEGQAQRLMAVFAEAGCEHVAPAIIQPAGLLLDVVGEDLRARTYVFADPDGQELCLRPDLTVPTCRLYLERHPEAATPARFSYNGPAFRYRPADSGRGNPREFRQAGAEFFAAEDADAADAEILALTLTALGEAGLRDVKIHIGDLGILAALLDALAIPERWRRRLRLTFWRPDAFRSELKRLSSAHDAAARRLPRTLVDGLDPADRAGVEGRIADMIEREGRDVFGTRSLAEVADGVIEAVLDQRAAPLAAADAALIEAYVAVACPALDAARRLESALRAPGVRVGAAIERFERRLRLMADAGADVRAMEFTGDFGRKFEYYTGFVFEAVTSELGPLSPIAGGGRYDGLLSAIGAPRPVPAVGVAIYTERLLEARSTGGGR
jgi:ATP phosphoribosyltransferase regulatory subunit